MHTSVAQPDLASVVSTKANSHPWLMLISRSVLFLCFQALIVLILLAVGRTHVWNASAELWTLMATLTNIVSIFLLVRLFKAEGKGYFEVIHFSRANLRGDLFWFFICAIVGLPIAVAPMNMLALLLFGDTMTPANMLFHPLPILGFRS